MVPSIFIAHGSPLLAVENNEYTQFLNNFVRTFPRPKAIVLFSAHYESSVQKVSEIDEYQMIYDFGGFPDELYQIKYPAKGESNIASEIKSLFLEKGVPFDVETKRGLDHGAWVVLRLLYPDADIPVVAMSVDPSLTPEEQYNVGKALAVLREKEVLIIGSGGTVHNLRALRWQDDGHVDKWAIDFDDWLLQHLVNWDLSSLFKYDSLANTAKFAVPPYGNEHFIPIFYAMGAADTGRIAKLVHRSYRYGNLSQSVWQFN